MSARIRKRTTRRMIVLLAFIGAVLTSAIAFADTIKLTPRADSVPFAFGSDRNSQTKDIPLEAPAPIPSEQFSQLKAAPEGDLATSDQTVSLPQSVVTPSLSPDPAFADVIHLKVTVNLSSTDRFKSGEFTGRVRVAGAGFDSQDIPLVVTLRSGPAWWALGLLIVGVAFGYLYKWNAEVGKKVSPLDRRYRILRRKLLPGGSLPPRLSEEMQDIDFALGSWDVDTATGKINEVDAGFDSVMDDLRSVAEIETEIAAHRAFLKNHVDAAGPGPSIPDLEAVRLRRLAEDVWPKPNDAQAPLAKLYEQVVMVSFMMNTDPSKYGDALMLYAQDRFDEGFDKAKSIASGEHPTTAALMARTFGAPLTVLASAKQSDSLREWIGGRWQTFLAFFRQTPGRWGRIKRWSAERFLPLLLGVAAAVAIGLVGWSSQYLKKPTFGAAGFGDWLALFLWGFAAGFSGKALSEYAKPV